MATNQRGRRIRYDNIAQGSALTTPERVISGQTVTPVEIYGGGYMTSTSTGEAWANNVKAGTSTSDEVSPGKIQENLIAGQTDSSLDENVAKGG